MYSVLNKLSEYIYFYISKTLLHTLSSLVYKIVESLQYNLNYPYLEKNCNLIAINLNEKQALEANPGAMQQIL